MDDVVVHPIATSRSGDTIKYSISIKVGEFSLDLTAKTDENKGVVPAVVASFSLSSPSRRWEKCHPLSLSAGDYTVQPTPEYIYYPLTSGQYYENLWFSLDLRFLEMAGSSDRSEIRACHDVVQLGSFERGLIKNFVQAVKADEARK